MKTLSIILITTLFFLAACKTNDDVRPNNNGSDRDVWLIDKGDIVNWNSEKDNIQSIDTNVFTTINNVLMPGDEKVFAYHYDGITKVYPLDIMGGHEISNDSIGFHYYSITYCPITASAITWNRNVNGKINQFGVSGKLYRNNLVPYDRVSGSHWTQMGSICVNGNLIGQEAETHLLLQTNISTIRDAYPDALILEHHDCEDGICTGLKSSDDLGDPVDIDDKELPPDAKYYGVVRDQSILLFELGLFTESMQLFETRFRSKNLVILGDQSLHYYAAFIINRDGPDHKFTIVNDELPVVMADTKGNRYDMFGNIVSGPEAGQRLLSPTAYLANTFAWDDMFTDIEIYKP